ncbi:hypothetical protein A33K_14420 [Burkholderia humptydooensis MSMB43]|uniref:Uncharacterized protein n=1 Tax=Burkholderia humptydooensis MSMB43 TaxID=441157 RepID=A0ABN0G7V4_9BURK|nr:hypothetical protein A33K_14420 [Burkholderia humptydooensis MSMB43]
MDARAKRKLRTLMMFAMSAPGARCKRVASRPTWSEKKGSSQETVEGLMAIA